MLDESSEDSERRQVLSDLRRMTKIVMDNLEDGSRKRLLDAKELRLLGSMVMRSTRLWLAAQRGDYGKEMDKILRQSGEKPDQRGREVEKSVRED